VKVNFREKEKQVLDNILGPGRYDARIRPSGENGTGEYRDSRASLFTPSAHPHHVPCNFVPTYLAAKSAEKCERRNMEKEERKEKKDDKTGWETERYTYIQFGERGWAPPLIECGKLNARCNTILPSSSLMRRNAQTTSARPESIDNTWYTHIISERDELCENFPHVLSECIPSGEKFLHKLCEYERQTGPVSTRSRDRPRNLETAWFFAILLSRSCHCLGIVTYSCFRRADESLTSGSIQVCE